MRIGEGAAGEVLARRPHAPRVLLVEDDCGLARLLADALARPPSAAVVRIATGVGVAQQLLQEERFALILLDRGLPDGDGIELLRAIVAGGAAPSVVVLTADDTATSAVDALKAGAVDYVVKSERMVEQVLARVGSLLDEHAPSSRGRAGDALVGESAAMQAVRVLLQRYAPSRACVLIEGETGVGKELVARALHAQSERASGPFVAINCGALPEHLVESELFGHARGAFTGAHRDHPGLVEHAERGTLFLDEIEDLPPALQGKLLRLLQESEYRPVGATRTRRADVRVVAASNAELQTMVRERRFRRDLFYRLDVLRIVVPPLRERVDDLPALLAHLARDVAARGASGVPSFIGPSAAQLMALRAYPWPGNVRELANLVERAAIVAATLGWPAGWTSALGQLHPDRRFDTVVAQAPARAGADATERAALLELLERHRWRRA
ncbi:sigma-54 dependent transcriptional regulator, partial [Candidatus Binatia bacterium]|nr:sigma-54 dependent transcriptional regulator [Candidatus Binatia bacterium]